MQIRGGNCNAVNACSVQGKTFILQRWSLVRFLMENQREMKDEGLGTASYAGLCNYYSNVTSFWYAKGSFLCTAMFQNVYGGWSWMGFRSFEDSGLVISSNGRPSSQEQYMDYVCPHHSRYQNKWHYVSLIAEF